MKKITAILFVLLMLSTTVFASTPAFLTQVINNYTLDYDVKITFDNSEDVVQLLRETEISDDIEDFVDLEALLRTGLSVEATMHTEMNMSEDYSKIQMGITSQSQKDIDINQNLRLGIDSKTGMWLDMDLSDENSPVFDVILQTPFMNKYMSLKGEQLLSYGDYELINSFLNKEYMDSLQKTYADIIMKYAKVEGSGNKYVIKLDNDGLTACLDDIIYYLSNGEDLLSFKGTKLLGNGGITAKFILSGGKLKTESINADISVDLAKIYTLMYEEEWEYDTNGTIDLTLDINANVSKIGNTSVNFPVLTQENTFDFEENDEEYIYEDIYEEDDTYYIYNVYETCDYLPVIDGDVYIPLRRTITNAFGDDASIGFDNDKIVIQSEYFDRYKTMTVDVNSDIVLLDGSAYKTTKPVVIDGTTYVHHIFFKEFFNWELCYANYDILSGEYYYMLYTNN